MYLQKTGLCFSLPPAQGSCGGSSPFILNEESRHTTVWCLPPTQKTRKPDQDWPQIQKCDRGGGQGGGCSGWPGLQSVSEQKTLEHFQGHCGPLSREPAWSHFKFFPRGHLMTEWRTAGDKSLSTWSKPDKPERTGQPVGNTSPASQKM